MGKSTSCRQGTITDGGIQLYLDLFNGKTGNGDDMARYDDLLAKSVDAITAMFKKRAIGALLSGRDGRLIPRSRQAEDADDFELITWLVIREAACTTVHPA